MQIKLKLTRAANAAAHGVMIGDTIMLEIEEYLKGVLPSEIYESRTPPEAKKAQAIAARTYALRAALNGSTLTDTPNHQSYNADKAAASPNCARAVSETADLVLTYGGEVIRCYYSNCNGGRTKRTDEVWSAKLPYYQSSADPWDEGARRSAAAQGKTIKASHGVGLSQVGAEYAARLGEDCAAMLAFYYPGTAICCYTPMGGEETMLTNKQFAEFCLKVYAAKWVYWYGTCGYACTKSLYSSKKKQYSSMYTASRESGYMKDIAGGCTCADCVGLIKAFFWKSGDVNGKNVRGANNCPDTNANGMYEKCKENGPIATIPDVPGLIVWKDGHIGVYVGNGYTVELKGFAYDCKKVKVASGSWTRWGRLPASMLDYVDGATATEPTPAKLGDRELTKGDEGDDVAELQRALKVLGYALGSFGPARDGIDGDFGSRTRAAVQAFQGDAGLDDSGVADAATIKVLVASAEAGHILTGSEDGAPEGGSEPAPTTFTVAIAGVDAATAAYLLETYPSAVAAEDKG